MAHYEDMLSHYGATTGMKIARKHIGWYSKGLYGSTEFRSAVNHEAVPERVKALISSFYGPLIEQLAA